MQRRFNLVSAVNLLAMRCSGSAALFELCIRLHYKMATITWADQEQTILVVNLGTGWNWRVFDLMIDEAFVWITSLAYPVGLIITDEAPTTPLPAGSPISHTLAAIQRAPANIDLAVVVARTDLTVTAVRVLIQLSARARDRLVVASSLEEAHQLFQAKRTRGH